MPDVDRGLDAARIASGGDPGVVLAAAPAAVPASLPPQAPPVAAAVEVPIALARWTGRNARAPTPIRGAARPATRPLADDGRFAVARADVPTFRTSTRPERIDQDEDDDGYGPPAQQARADDRYGAPVRSAPRDAYDDEDAPPPTRGYGARYARYVGGPYDNTRAYGWNASRGANGAMTATAIPRRASRTKTMARAGGPQGSYGGR